MRATVLTLILGWAWSSALAQLGDSAVADLRQVVVDLSDDEFGNRERATRLLWESGDRALVAEIVEHGTTAEARSRAAQVLTSYQWGIVPGITPLVRAQIDQFRTGSLGEKRLALSELMQAGHLQIVAGGLLLTNDPVQRDQLNQHLRAMMRVIVPRAFAAGREGEVRALLQALAPEWSAYARDLKALDFQAEPLSSSSRIDGDAPRWLLSLQSDDLLDKLWKRRVAGREAAVFDLLARQQRLPEAVEALRRVMRAEAEVSAEDVSAEDVLRRYLAREGAQVKTQNYSKKALGLAHEVDFQPTGFALSEGARSVLRFCHEYGLPELIEEAGRILAAQTKATAPAALPAFCAWASCYPELRELAIGSAVTACDAGIPPEFAIAPMCNPYSQQGRWFGQFISPQEKRGLLLHDVRNGGWGALGNLKEEWRRSSAVRGYVAMATGAWEIAALAFVDAATEAGTLAEGAVFGYLASVSYERTGQLESAKQWHQIAGLMPLADEEARAALADTMQRYGDLDGALRNRRQLIDLHSQGRDQVHLLHALRMIARSLDLSEPSNLPFATRIATQLLTAIGSVEEDGIASGEVAWDSAFYHQCRMLNAIGEKRSDIATMELLAAHQCAPGALEVFETLVSLKENGGRNLLQAARMHLAYAENIWEQAAAAFPGNAAIERKISRCRVLGARLAAAGE